MAIFHGPNATTEIARLALFMTIANNYNQLMITIRIVISKRNTFCEVGTILFWAVFDRFVELVDILSVPFRWALNDLKRPQLHPEG
jgi:hypothetical protein